MATHVIDHTAQTNDTSQTLMIAFVLLLVIGFILFFALPALRSGVQTTPQINVPDRVDVNLNQK